MTENLQYRLYNASIEPPGDAWPKIAGQLDQTAQEHLALKLQEATLEPPVNAWGNIVATLDADTRPAVIPINRNWKKWAAAAVAASIIIIAGWLYLRPTRPTEAGTASTTNTTKEDTTTEIETTSPGYTVATPEQGNKRRAINTSSLATRINPSRMLAFASNTSIPIRYAHVNGSETPVDNDNVQVDEAIDQNVSMHANAYISPKQYLTVAAPNGQPARISAKFTDAVSYVFNNQPTENLDMAIRSFSWQQRFRNWSNKLMSNAAFIPAATNFLDIIELEELLKE